MTNPVVISMGMMALALAIYLPVHQWYVTGRRTWILAWKQGSRWPASWLAWRLPWRCSSYLGPGAATRGSVHDWRLLVLASPR